MLSERNWGSNESMDDRNIEAEFGDVIAFVRKDKTAPKPPRELNRKILSYARAQQPGELEKSWLLGQGPRVVLVTLIAFAVLVFTLMLR